MKPFCHNHMVNNLIRQPTYDKNAKYPAYIKLIFNNAAQQSTYGLVKIACYITEY